LTLVQGAMAAERGSKRQWKGLASTSKPIAFGAGRGDDGPVPEVSPARRQRDSGGGIVRIKDAAGARRNALSNGSQDSRFGCANLRRVVGDDLRNISVRAEALMVSPVYGDGPGRLVVLSGRDDPSGSGTMAPSYRKTLT
jgi:hypothetical protein